MPDSDVWNSNLKPENTEFGADLRVPVPTGVAHIGPTRSRPRQSTSNFALRATTDKTARQPAGLKVEWPALVFGVLSPVHRLLSPACRANSSCRSPAAGRRQKLQRSDGGAHARLSPASPWSVVRCPVVGGPVVSLSGGRVVCSSGALTTRRCLYKVIT